MKRYLKLYIHFFKYNIIQEAIYRGDFIAWSLVTLGWMVFTIVFYQLLFTQIDNIAGWNKHQILILQGFYFFLDAVVWGLFYQNFYDLPKKINTGNLDLELVKPINKQFLLSTKKFSLNHVNNIIVGFGIILYSLQKGNIQPDLISIIFTIIIFLIAVIFVYSSWFITICAAFWFERLENIIYLFPSFRQFAKFPLSAYQGVLKLFLTYIIPITLVTTLPSKFLIGKPDYHLLVILIGFAISSLFFSNWFFKISLKRYSSASS